MKINITNSCVRWNEKEVEYRDLIVLRFPHDSNDIGYYIVSMVNEGQKGLISLEHGIRLDTNNYKGYTRQELIDYLNNLSWIEVIEYIPDDGFEITLNRRW